jgi:YD repeat-containing protein
MVGNVVSVTDPKNNSITKTYRSATNYVLPQYTVNALGQQSEETWKQYCGYSGFYYYNGDPAAQIDANGAQVQYWFDALGRTTQVTTPFETKT